jgi:transcriptional regulator with XRE-family HTH domain
MPKNTSESVFGTRVKAARSARGMTMQDLADAAGLKFNQVISRIEMTGSASLPTATRIAKALGVSLDYLVGLSNSDEEVQRRVAILTQIEELKAQL